jgi:hypothetical protein
MVVAAVDHRDLDRRTSEPIGCLKSAKTGADDYNAMGHGASMSSFAGSVQQAFANQSIANAYR